MDEEQRKPAGTEAGRPAPKPARTGRRAGRSLADLFAEMDDLRRRVEDHLGHVAFTDDPGRRTAH